jgi:predicted nucleic acid-binding protein
MDRIFLDANVLFSAAYGAGTRGGGLCRLWELVEVELVTSAYAVEEARRNLSTEEQRARLEELANKVRVVPEMAGPFPVRADLPEKDLPILGAAMQAGATHLITGDQAHFGPFYGRMIAGVLILRPAAYLRSKA